jgi:hypothetical protein
MAPRAARADDRLTLSGAWSASALTEQWALGDWGDACGPRPTPQGAGGGAVQVKENGNELSISGAGRGFSTAECWEQMPGLARTSHSASGGGRFWRTRCSTGANDSRRATVVTTIQATDSTMSMVETGQYQFVIKDQNCTASVTRSRSFTLVRRDGDVPAPASASAAPIAPPPATVPPPPPAPVATESRATPRCTAGGSGGDPARLEVYPGKKLLRPGDRFAFRAVVRDAEGCPLSIRPVWSLVPGPLASKATVDAAGQVTVAADAGEGQLGLTAAVGGKGVTVPIEVASEGRYDALLAAGGLNDAGEIDQAAVAVIATGTIGGSLALAEDSGRERKIAFVAIVGAVAAGLGFVGLVLLRRGRRGGAVGEDAAGIPEGAEEDQANAGVPAPQTSAPEAPAPAARAPNRPRGKICPTCGERYEGEATYCGKDATKLVLIN